MPGEDSGHIMHTSVKNATFTLSVTKSHQRVQDG